MASPVQPPEHIEIDNDNKPAAVSSTGPVQPGDQIDFTSHN